MLNTLHYGFSVTLWNMDYSSHTNEYFWNVSWTLISSILTFRIVILKTQSMKQRNVKKIRHGQLSIANCSKGRRNYKTGVNPNWYCHNSTVKCGSTFNFTTFQHILKTLLNINREIWSLHAEISNSHGSDYEDDSSSGMLGRYSRAWWLRQ